MNALGVADVLAALEQVPDPELPAVSVVDLGVVADVRVDGARVEVDLIPTFTACPATALMRDDVAAALRALPGVAEAVVRHVAVPVWTPARISPAGVERLREFGVAMGESCPSCGSVATRLDSAFGPTPCRSCRLCEHCRQPFEAMKP